MGTTEGEGIMLVTLDNALNYVFNKLKGFIICSIKGHDVVMTQCFRCWKWDKTWMDK